MTPSANVLDFFILEANEYIDRLDTLVGTAGPNGPDTDALARPARALRGSATMSRQGGIAELAGALERTIHARRDGRLAWDPAVSAAFVAAVDDLRQLLRRTRDWQAADDQRVRQRVAELDALAPGRPTPVPTPAAIAGTTYLVSATAGLAQAVEQYTLHPDDRTLLPIAMSHARTLRGVAAIRDIPPTADLVDAVERVGKSLELTTASPTTEQLAVLSAAAVVLRRISTELATHGRPSSDSPDVLRFGAAVAALDEQTDDADRVVPIEQLFYADAGPHVVSATANPPTNPADRFRLEVVSQAEHIRRLVDEARAAPEIAAAERLTRELRAALRALRATAESFGEHHVVRFANAWSTQVSAAHPAALAALDAAADLLSNQTMRREDVVRELDKLASGRPASAEPATTSAPPEVPTAVIRDSGPREPVRTPTGKDLRAFLESGITTIEQLREQPLSEPVALACDEIVPIEQLLYRGRAALERAAALRDEIRGSAAPSPDVLDELFDLLDLALTD